TSELEPNDTSAQANAFKEPMIGTIAAGGDIDVISYQVAADGTTLAATTKEIPGIGCKLKYTDSYLTLYDVDGATPLASNDNNPGGTIAKLVVKNLAAGTYFLALSASPSAPAGHTFDYRWSIQTSP